MLKSLTIQDLAVVRHLDVEFEQGLTILTGETGAGKSILIEALGLTLGDRADSGMVRSGAARASVSASFDVSANAALKTLLKDNDLEDEAECILRRVVGADGRSRAFCNAAPIPVQLLKQIGELLVDIHGQHAHHSLLRKPVQRAALDGFGKHARQLDAVASSYAGWRELRREFDALSDGEADVPSRIDLLQFQVEEIEALGVSSASLEQLDAEHRRIAHASRILEACDGAAEAAFGEAGALAQGVRALHELREVSQLDNGIATIIDLLETATINLEEAERELAQLQAGVDTDPLRLQAIEAELQRVQDVARKHRCEARALPQRLVELEAELESLKRREGRIGELDAAIEKSLAAYHAAATNLSKARRASAKKMGREITTRLRELGIPHGEFAIEMHAHEGVPSPNGAEEVEFVVTANPDQPLKPLRKVASGGELSRVSLAIQVATSGTSGIPVLVFDEVDTGIGGPTADVVAQNLAALATARQILCITHLPQVASAGDHHLSIGKVVKGGFTETAIRLLDAEERIDEIARMLGGQRVTDKARDHARELLTH